MNGNLRWWQVTSVSLALVALIGCGRRGPDPIRLGEVTGVVKLDGQPFPGALVEFNPQAQPDAAAKKGAGTSGSAAVSGADGTYKLQFTNDRAGAVLGTHTIRVTEIPEDEGPPRKIRIPQKYAGRSGLTFEVKEGANSFDLELKSEIGRRSAIEASRR